MNGQSDNGIETPQEASDDGASDNFGSSRINVKNVVNFVLALVPTLCVGTVVGT